MVKWIGEWGEKFCAERKDELRSTASGVSRWHGHDRTTLELSWLPALWIVSSIVLLEILCLWSEIVWVLDFWNSDF